MKKIILIIALLIALSLNCLAINKFGLVVVEEEDGSPSVPVHKIKVANGGLTDNGDGTASIPTGGDTAIGFFTNGTLELIRGGLETDVSLWEGVVGITGGLAFEVDTAAELETLCNLGAFASDLLGYANAAAVLAGIGAEGDLSNSAGLAAALSDEKGTEYVAFTDSPAFTTGMTLSNGFHFRPATTNANDSFSIDVYDTDDTAYISAIQFINGDSAGTKFLGYVDMSEVDVLTLKGLTGELILKDQSAPGSASADKDGGYMEFDYINGAEDSENFDWIVSGIQGGAKTEIVRFDESEDHFDFSKTIFPDGGIKSITPVTDDADNFATAFTGANMYGGTFVANAAGTAQLPAVAVGMNFTIITLGAVAVVVEPNASDNFILDGVQLDDADSATNLSTAGDQLTCEYYSSAGWVCQSNGWTDED